MSSLQITFLLIIAFWYTTNNTSIFETDNTISQRVWDSMNNHVLNDLQYLKSLATSDECKQKIEEEYIQHISYSVVRKEDSYSFDLQNLCVSNKTNINHNDTHIITNNNNTIAKNNNNLTNTHLFLHKFAKKPYESIRIIYCIIMYQNPFQVIRLISTLNTSFDHFLIHIDKKSSQNIINIIKQFAELHINIHLLESQAVTWGGFSIIEVQLKAMKYAIRCLTSIKFDFFMILSESDYPLVSIKHIKYFLHKYIGKTLMRNIKPLENNKIQSFLRDVYCECDNSLYHVGRRQIYESVTIYSSSLWATYHYSFIEYIVNDDEIVPDFIDFFRPTAVSDETFFATVLMNSPLCNTYVDDINWYEWRLELWPYINADKNLIKCRHSSNTAFCGVGPIDIIYEYLPILQSTNALFARKFNTKKDELILNVIDIWRNNSQYLLPELSVSDNSYNSGKPKLLSNHKLITIASSFDKCLSYTTDIDEYHLYQDECVNDNYQLFMLTKCTDSVYLDNNQCLQSTKQYESSSFAICEIRTVQWNHVKRVYEADDNCLSVLYTLKGIKQGNDILISKCNNDGFSQQFYFNECNINYGSPLLNYLPKPNQYLCVGFCDGNDIDENDSLSCLKTCSEANVIIKEAII